jgi:hypothetical protein
MRLWVARLPLSPQAHAIDSYAPCADDEVGHPLLFKDAAVSRFEHVYSGFYARDGAISEEVMRRANSTLWGERTPNNALQMQLVNDTAHAPAFRARADYQRRLVDVLGELMAISAPLLPRPAAFVDYAAWIRHMVDVDDQLEQAWMTASASGRQGLVLPTSTRSTRSGPRYARWIMLDERLRRVLKETALRMPDEER